MKTIHDPLPQALADLASLGKIRQRKMFGGVYIYCDDLFIATVHDATLYFKANAQTAPDLVARGLSQFGIRSKAVLPRFSTTKRQRRCFRASTQCVSGEVRHSLRRGKMRAQR